MDCEYYRELISCLIDGELSADEEAALADHLETCPECASMYSAFKELSCLMEEDMEDAPENLCINVMAEVRRAEIMKKNRRKSAIKAVLATAACAVFAIAAGRMVGFNADSTVNDSAVMFDVKMAETESFAVPAEMPGEASGSTMMFTAPAAPAAMAEPEAAEEMADTSMDSVSVRQANSVNDAGLDNVEAKDWLSLNEILNGQPAGEEVLLPDSPVLSMTVFHEGVYYSVSFFELDGFLYYFDPIEGIIKQTAVGADALSNA